MNGRTVEPSASAAEPIRVEVSEFVATVTLDRPPVNAVDRKALVAIRDAFRSLQDRRDVRAAVFTAAGSRAFMGGRTSTSSTRHETSSPPLR